MRSEWPRILLSNKLVGEYHRGSRISKELIVARIEDSLPLAAENLNIALTEEHGMNSLTRHQGVVTVMVLLAAITAAIFTTPAQAQSVVPIDQWTLSITPYLWLPNVNGTMKYGIPPGSGGRPEVETGPNDYLQALQTVIMVSGEVRRDRWSVFTDLIYLDFADQKSTVKTVDFGGNLVSAGVNLATSSSLRGTAWTLGTGYAVMSGQAVTLDVFGGLRYFDLKVSTDWQLEGVITGPGGGQTFPRTGGISERMVLWDGIVGVKGRIPLGSSDWSMPYYLDVGAGSSSLTWQGMLGVTYSFKWGGVTLAYRNLYYDQKDDQFIQDLRFSGPALGVTFRF